MKIILLVLFITPLLFGANGWRGGTWGVDQLEVSQTTLSVDVDDKIVSDSASSSLIILDSDNANPVNRDLILQSPSMAGQMLVLMNNGNGGVRITDNASVNGGAGSVKLSSNWSSATESTLTLFSTSTDWVEIARSLN